MPKTRPRPEDLPEIEEASVLDDTRTMDETSVSDDHILELTSRPTKVSHSYIYTYLLLVLPL